MKWYNHSADFSILYVSKIFKTSHVWRKPEANKLSLKHVSNSNNFWVFFVPTPPQRKFAFIFLISNPLLTTFTANQGKNFHFNVNFFHKIFHIFFNNNNNYYYWTIFSISFTEINKKKKKNEKPLIWKPLKHFLKSSKEIKAYDINVSRCWK